MKCKMMASKKISSAELKVIPPSKPVVSASAGAKRCSKGESITFLAYWILENGKFHINFFSWHSNLMNLLGKQLLSNNKVTLMIKVSPCFYS